MLRDGKPVPDRAPTMSERVTVSRYFVQMMQMAGLVAGQIVRVQSHPEWPDATTGDDRRHS